MNKTNALSMYAALMGVGICSSLAIVTTYELTQPIIRTNRIRMRQQAVLRVLPGAESSVAFCLSPSGEFEQTRSDIESPSIVYAGYDSNDQLVGVAFETQGAGYQDVIRTVYGYSFETQSIVGLAVLESRETPGLGDRIETDEKFLENFRALPVRLNEQGTAIEHPIEFSRAGSKSNAWQIDGISGATISSRAVAEMLSASSAEWIPKVTHRRKDFIDPDTESGDE